MSVSENSGTPKSSILIGFSIINHPFGGTPIFGNTQLHTWSPTSASEDKQLLSDLRGCNGDGVVAFSLRESGLKVKEIAFLTCGFESWSDPLRLQVELLFKI